MTKSAAIRATHYANKLDPVLIALRYKAQSVWFQPQMIELQTILDNTDKNIKDVLDTLNFPPLRRNNAKLFMQGFYKVLDSFSGQTLVDKVNELLVKYNLSQDDFNGIVEYMRNILTQEQVYDKCSIDRFNMANVRIADTKLFKTNSNSSNALRVLVSFDP